jgi:hypothetical protein
MIRVVIGMGTKVPPGSESLCFNAGSFWVISAVTSVLVGAISTLFGMLMLSYRSRIQTAEQRETAASRDRDEAVAERNEALYRMEATRGEYRSFVEHQARRALPGRRKIEGAS